VSVGLGYVSTTEYTAHEKYSGRSMRAFLEFVMERSVCDESVAQSTPASMGRGQYPRAGVSGVQVERDSIVYAVGNCIAA
jgi:hypothetical protein